MSPIEVHQKVCTTTSQEEQDFEPIREALPVITNRANARAK